MSPVSPTILFPLHILLLMEVPHEQFFASDLAISDGIVRNIPCDEAFWQNFDGTAEEMLQYLEETRGSHHTTRKTIEGEPELDDAETRGNVMEVAVPRSSAPATQCAQQHESVSGSLSHGLVKEPSPPPLPGSSPLPQLSSSEKRLLSVATPMVKEPCVKKRRIRHDGKLK